MGDDPTEGKAQEVAAINLEVVEQRHEVLDITPELIAALDLG